jgi:hypothetical protein
MSYKLSDSLHHSHIVSSSVLCTVLLLAHALSVLFPTCFVSYECTNRYSEIQIAWFRFYTLHEQIP